MLYTYIWCSNGPTAIDMVNKFYDAVERDQAYVEGEFLKFMDGTEFIDGAVKYKDGAVTYKIKIGDPQIKSKELVKQRGIEYHGAVNNKTVHFQFIRPESSYIIKNSDSITLFNVGGVIVTEVKQLKDGYRYSCKDLKASRMLQGNFEWEMQKSLL